MSVKIFVAFLALSFASVESSRILFFHTSLSRSHVIPMQVLAKALAKRSHEITFVSAFPLEKSVENYRDIKIQLSEEDSRMMEEMSKAMGKGQKSKNFFTLLSILSTMFYKVGNETLQTPNVKRLMAEEKFDLVITGYFMTEYLLGLATHFNYPSIVFFSGNLISPTQWIATQEFSQPRFGCADNSSLLQLSRAADLRVSKNQNNNIFISDTRYNFPPSHYRSYDETLTNVSAVLINTHFTSAAPRPNLPNMVEVGGLQIKPTPSLLPENLKEFLDNAKDGAILFSFGSNAQSQYLPEEKIQTLMRVFSRLKQRVVMKWESDTLPGKPSNVFISKWLPQDDVLAHPSMRLFISHCGYGGVIEAKYHGVPIIGMPLGGDQASNAEKIVEEGWAIRLDFETLSEATLTKAIEEILSNGKYRDIVRRESELSRDRPLNAQETAIYWVEYVLRHRGAPHLHYPGADLNFLQDNSIDVMLAIAGVLYAVVNILKFTCRLIFCRRAKKSGKLKRN